jgi:predicted nicotinamide N-methyase
VKRYSSRQITRTLKKYDITEVEVVLDEDLRLSMVETADAYALLDRLIEQEEKEGGRNRVTRFPYWAEIWPAALALSKWFTKLALPPERALELGCGLGLVGVTLARLGWTVDATDFVEDALVFTAHNAERNGAGSRHTVSYLDWSHPVGTPSPVLVGSDVAYEKILHPYLQRTVRALLAPGGRLIVSDPGRPAARPFIESMARAGYEHRQEQVEVTWNALDHHIDIHTFIRPA